MALQVLVATMNQPDYELLKKMNINSNAIIINQCGKKSVDNIDLNGFDIKWIDSNERGLSKSRNMAINNANLDICIFADDDLIYLDNYKETVEEQFKLYPEADIITFQVEGIERKFKNYYSNPRKLNYITSMKVSSVEIAFRLQSLRDKQIEFNEIFGAGAKYFAGEENILLYDSLRKGLEIQYVPIKIADLYVGESTLFKWFNKEYFIAKGAIFTAMSYFFSIPLIFQFAIRKYKLYKKQNTIYSAINYMFKGRNKYLNERLINR